MPRQRKVVSNVPDTKTAKWLDSALRNTNLHSQLNSAVSLKLPKSRLCGLTEDHIQNSYVRWLEADALAKHLGEDGKAPSNLRWFAIKGAYKDIREWGREPLMRISIGARTETDLKKTKAALDVTANISPKSQAPTQDRATFPHDFDVGDMPGPVVEVTLEMDAEDLLKDLRDRLEAAYGTADQHMAVILAYQDDATDAEAALAAGVSVPVARRLRQEVQRIATDLL